MYDRFAFLTDENCLFTVSRFLREWSENHTHAIQAFNITPISLLYDAVYNTLLAPVLPQPEFPPVIKQ